MAQDKARVDVMRIGQAPEEAYPGGEIHWLVSREANGSQELTLGYNVMQPGRRNPLHRHPNCEEALYVIGGEIEHVIEGQANLRMTAGDAICIPRNVWHQAINIGSVPAHLLVSFSSATRATEILE